MALSRITNPFLSSSGAGNASITSPAANTVAFTTATTERMRINSSGNIGIGTASPTGRMEVAATGVPVLRLSGTQTSPNNILMTGGSSYNYGVIGVNTGNNTSTGDIFQLGYTASAGAAPTSVLQWSSAAKCIGLNTTPSTTGTGITFPATQNASSDPNTLDDYEEGTFTPTFRSDGDNALITFSTSARYIKIGTYVYFTILATRNQSSVTSGALYMQSLPFTSVSSSPTIQLGGISWFDNGGVTTDYTAMTYVEGSSNTVFFTQFTNPSQQAAARYVQAQNLSNNRPIYITGSYITAS